MDDFKKGKLNISRKRVSRENDYLDERYRDKKR